MDALETVQLFDLDSDNYFGNYNMLIGSVAIGMHCPEFRKPKDVDVITPDITHGTSGGLKVERLWDDSLNDMVDKFWYQIDKAVNVPGVGWCFLPSLDFLYTLKISHSFWSLRNQSWGKHTADIIWLQRNTDAKFLRDVYDYFYPLWKEKHGAKRASLNKTPEEFFTASVKRTYEHDSVHASVAYGDEPLFKRILKDDHEVMVDWSKFEAMDHQTRLNLVREEIYATALERNLIPKHDGKPTVSEREQKNAYRENLFKVITSYWKGEWALWVLLNLSELDSPDVNYWDRHRSNKERLITL